MQNDDLLLSRTEVEARFGITRRWLELAALSGDGPPMIKIGKRLVRYRVGDVLAWLETRRVRSTSEVPGDQR